MDNFKMDVVSEGDDSLGHALALAFAQHGTAKWWRTDTRDGKPRLVLSWITGPTAVAEMQKDGWLPFLNPVGPRHAVGLAQDWLANQDYGPQPDHDGDNGKGWRVYCDGWGHVEPYGYKAFVAVEPAWAMYGK